MRSWPKPQRQRQKRKLPRLRPKPLVLLMQEQHPRLLEDRGLLPTLQHRLRKALAFMTGVGIGLYAMFSSTCERSYPKASAAARQREHFFRGYSLSAFEDAVPIRV